MAAEKNMCAPFLMCLRALPSSIYINFVKLSSFFPVISFFFVLQGKMKIAWKLRKVGKKFLMNRLFTIFQHFSRFLAKQSH